jgi:heat shock protein HtpX
MKRVVLFVATNIAILLVIKVILNVFGLDRIADQHGLNFGALLGFSAVLGFVGAIISLLVSKPMAKWQTGARVIAHPSVS